jgi:hypothetical protein
MGTVFALFGIAIAGAVTIAFGGPSPGKLESYDAAFFIGGLLFASPFFLVAAWIASARPGQDRFVRRETTAKVAIGLGAFRWLGLFMTVGPVFAQGSLLLIAGGWAILSLRGGASPGQGQ